jgi:hypothetical protein
MRHNTIGATEFAAYQQIPGELTLAHVAKRRA